MSDALVLLSKCLPTQAHRIISSAQALVGPTAPRSGSRIVENINKVEARHKVELCLELIAKALADLGAKVGVLGRTGQVIWRQPVSILQGSRFPVLVAICGFDEGWRQLASGTGREGSTLVLLAEIGEALMQNLTSTLLAQHQWPSLESPITMEKVVYIPYPVEFDAAEAAPGTSKAGRPSRHNEVQEAYEKHFPQGHGNLQWKVVHSVLKLDVSLDTLKRALGRR